MHEIIEGYIFLEKRLQTIMNASCSPHCSCCQSPCCRIDFCRESRESPFLREVRRHDPPSVSWHGSRGWLTAGGCALGAGRPPVCYEFLCDGIAQHYAGGKQLEALKLLAMLLTVAGRRAAGPRHLVEVNDLDRLNLPRLARQLAAAGAVLTDLEKILMA